MGLKFASGQPLLLWDAKLKGEPLSDSTRAGWCAYLKGAARSSMALFIAAMAMKNDWNLPILAPQLYTSLQVIHCRRGILSTDLANVALENATLSRKGSLIKQHDVATWLSKLMLLRSHGLNPSQILQTWNSRSTRDAQIVGAKKVALMNLLDISPEVVSVLLAHASEFGDRVAFSEECFSNKQILPGYVPRGSNKVWNKRIAVTPESMLVMVRAVDTQHRRKLPEARSKLSKDSMSEAAQLAALVLLVEDECRSLGIPEPDLVEKFFGSKV